ncbi:unnamed protein product [Symbiodinium sp. CCMP2592]|nr:unnamed protein product [Symbiodinium sp. CCMP2592]
MVGNLLNPMVALSKPVEEGEVDREPHHLAARSPGSDPQGAAELLWQCALGQGHLEHGGTDQERGPEEVPEGFSPGALQGGCRAARRKDFLDLRLKAKSWMEARGFGEPKCPEDYAIILRRMSFEERLRLRAEYDHRVTLPIDSLPLDLKAFFSGKHKWAVAFQYYRCTGGAWVKAPDFVDRPNRRHWIHMECGMVLPALSGFDYTRVGSSKRSKNRYACTLCRTEWGRDSAEGKWLKGHEMHGWLLEIFDGDVVLQAIVTAPPQAERERWIQGRMLFCRKFEGTAPLLDAAPHKMPGQNPSRIRLGPDASTQLWRLVFSEPSLEALQSLDVLADAVKEELTADVEMKPSAP